MSERETPQVLSLALIFTQRKQMEVHVVKPPGRFTESYSSEGSQSSIRKIKLFSLFPIWRESQKKVLACKLLLGIVF